MQHPHARASTFSPSAGVRQLALLAAGACIAAVTALLLGVVAPAHQHAVKGLDARLGFTDGEKPTELAGRNRTRSSVGARLVLAGLAAMVVLALTLAPRSLVAPARGAFMQMVDAVDAPLVAGMTHVQLESTLNALMFVPLGAALAALLGTRLWILAPVIGFVVSLTVEYTQAQVPGRVPDIQDIVWNTLGAIVGAVVGAIVSGLIRRVARPPAGRSDST